MSNVAEAEAKEETEEEEEEERASASVHYSAVFLRHGIWQPSAVLQPLPSARPSSVRRPSAHLSEVPTEINYLARKKPQPHGCL